MCDATPRQSPFHHANVPKLTRETPLRFNCCLFANGRVWQFLSETIIGTIQVLRKHQKGDMSLFRLLHEGQRGLDGDNFSNINEIIFSNYSAKINRS